MRARGYILVETIVALLVLTLVLGAVLTTVVEASRRRTAASETRRALGLARSEFAAVGATIPAAPGTASGLDQDLAWRVDIAPVAAPGPLGTLARVTVLVGPANGRARVRLSELRMFGPVPTRIDAPAGRPSPPR